MAVANPLRLDPTRTLTYRRAFAQSLLRVFRSLQKDIYDLIVKEDAFGLVDRPTVRVVRNKRWQYQTQDEAVKNFDQWLQQRIARGVTSRAEADRWRKYIERGFEKGAARAFDDSLGHRGTGKNKRGGGFVEGDRERFVRETLSKSTLTEKLRLLQTRALNEVEGMTQDLRQKARRALTDGLVKGLTPVEIAASLSKVLKVSLGRAETIAYTELVRAHAEAQLATMEQLGIEHVGVAVEWSTASNPCKMCAPLAGIVLTVKEARGMIPRHPRCMCAWTVANVGESKKGQKRSKGAIEKAVKKSEKADQSDSDWGPNSTIAKTRPKSQVGNVHNNECSCCAPLRAFAELLKGLT